MLAGFSAARLPPKIDATAPWFPAGRGDPPAARHLVACGAGTRGAPHGRPLPALDPWVTGDSGETPPDAHADLARADSSRRKPTRLTGLESKASRARARRLVAHRRRRVPAVEKRRGRVAACARRALATVGKHRGVRRTTAVAAIASWRCLARARGAATNGGNTSAPPRAHRDGARTPSQRASARWTRRSRKGSPRSCGTPRARSRPRASPRRTASAARSCACAQLAQRGRAAARDAGARAARAAAAEAEASPPLGASPRAWRRRRAAPRASPRRTPRRSAVAPRGA